MINYIKINILEIGLGIELDKVLIQRFTDLIGSTKV